MEKKIKRKLLALICVSVMIIGIFPLEVQAGEGNWIDFASGSLTGSGTVEDPYLIQTAEDLSYLSKQVNAGTSFSGVYFKLMNDIDLSAHYWTPIGAEISYLFQGVFDGNNYEINGMTIGSAEQPATYKYIGLFGLIKGPGSVTNTKVINAAVYGGENQPIAGALLGGNWGGNVSGCYTTGHVEGGVASNVGGVVGYNTANYDVGVNAGNISNCGTECSVTGGKGATVGGFVGHSHNDTSIYNCYAAGDVEGEGASANFLSRIGGFAGDFLGSIQNCYATGDVSGGDSAGIGQTCNVGGFAGGAFADIYNCYATGDVSGGQDANVGGFAGRRNATFKNINVYWNSSAEQKVNGQIRKNTELLGVGELFSGAVDTSYGLGQEVMQGSSSGSSITYTYNTTGDTAVTGNTAGAFVQALNRGIGTLEAGKTYFTWAADSSSTNKGYPILTSSPASSLPNTYTVAAQNDGNGTGGASPSLAEAGETVKLGAVPSSNYFFKEWQVISPLGLVITNDEFVMPSEAVTVKVIFEEGWTVTFKNDDSDYSTQTLKKGSGIGPSNWPANPTKTNYTFDGWYTEPNGAGTLFTASTAVNNNIAVYAKWTPVTNGISSPSSSSGGGSSNTSHTKTTTPNYTAAVFAVDTTGNNLNSNSMAVEVDQKKGTAALNLGSQESKVIENGGNLDIKVPSINGVIGYTLGIPVATLKFPGQTGALTFQSNMGSVLIPANMLSGMTEENGTKAEITLRQGDKSVLPETAKDAIGNRPLIQLNMRIDGKQIEWNNPNSPITISIPYKPTEAELANPESIVIWYIDGRGNAISVPNGHYDAAIGEATFTTTHFSNYAVGYSNVKFTDVPTSAWYDKAVSFIAARGITSGTGNNKYSPKAKLTRGEFLVMMMKAYGISADSNPTLNFSDAGNTYYTGYLAAAKRLNITDGVGNNRFAPNEEITRQEMFTLLYHTLKQRNELPESTSSNTMAAYSDAGEVASWAKPAMTLFVEAGVIKGENGKIFAASTTTRAEMAQVLYSLL